MRNDGARPPGMHPFEVEIQGVLDTFKLVDLGGVYQVSTVPPEVGLCRVYIRLFGKNILGSPITAEVNATNYGPGPSYAVQNTVQTATAANIAPITPTNADDALSDLLDELEQY